MQNSSKGNNSWKNHRTRTRRWYAHPPSILNIPMKFQWNPTSSFREFAWTRTVPYIFMQNSSKGNNFWKNHRTRTRRWYAHPPLILNIPMKFHWNPTSSFREFAWTRAGRTHGRTDARTKRRLYAPPKFFGEHKNVSWMANCSPRSDVTFADLKWDCTECWSLSVLILRVNTARDAVLTSTTIYTLSRNMKNISIFLWKFSFFGGKIFIIFE